MEKDKWVNKLMDYDEFTVQILPGIQMEYGEEYNEVFDPYEAYVDYIIEEYNIPWSTSLPGTGTFLDLVLGKDGYGRVQHDIHPQDRVEVVFEGTNAECTRYYIEWILKAYKKV